MSSASQKKLKRDFVGVIILATISGPEDLPQYPMPAA